MVSSLPEEIIEQIIALALKQDFSSSDSTGPAASPTSILLVSKAFERITKPLLYTNLRFRTREQSATLAATLTAHPHLVNHVRSLRVDGPSTSQSFLHCAQLLANRCSCFRVDARTTTTSTTTTTTSTATGAPNQKPPFPKLDVSHAQRLRRCTIHPPLKSIQLQLVDDRDRTGHHSGREDLEHLCTALSMYLPDTIRLEVRQRGYLSCSAVYLYINALAAGVRRWPSLTQVDFHHRPTPLPSPGLHTPDPLALALANSPSLRLVRARRPTLLNTFLVELARNPVLRRIELLDEKDAERRYGVGGSGVVEFGEPDVEGGMLGMDMGTGMSGWIGGRESTGGMGGGGGSASGSSFGLDDVEAYEEDGSLPPSPSSPASRILSYSLLNYQSASHRAQQQSSPVLDGSMNSSNGANGQPLSPASQLREAVMPQVMRMNNVDTDVLERARREVASEPQTLFAAQAVAHPRLRALTQAGRLQVVYDRLLVEKEREKEREMGKEREREKQEGKEGKEREGEGKEKEEPILTTTTTTMTPVLAVGC
ncbi:hypothetical protein PNOK_0620500 [Pyrrhoderma noxium]|uniref:F-box domain-containing protein n=1 Tax=Pyrrhoderma noxium TaxID=2282107 RepID=A0A286UDX5_9AGAM|nr:hypothetical protein PNOK_0620500 [Pyrrhoderma noxium]